VLFKKRGGKRGAALDAFRKASVRGAAHQRPFLHARYPFTCAADGRPPSSTCAAFVYHAIREGDADHGAARRFPDRGSYLHRTARALILEADANAAAAGMQGFQGPAAKHLNAATEKETKK